MNSEGVFKLFLLTCMLWSTLRKSFIPVRCSTSWKMATRSVGVMAMERVSSTRAKRDHRRFRKPFVNKTQEHENTDFFKPIFCDITNRPTDLHDKLPRVSAGHGRTLSSCQDPHRPDVKGCRAKETAQDHSLNTQIYTHRERNDQPYIYHHLKVRDLVPWIYIFFLTRMLWQWAPINNEPFMEVFNSSAWLKDREDWFCILHHALMWRSSSVLILCKQG